MKRTALALALALAFAAPSPTLRAQDMGKKDDSDEAAKLAAEMVKEAKRFTTSVKISAKDAVAKATQKQPGIVVSVKAEEETSKDKEGKEQKTDCFEVTIVARLPEGPAKGQSPEDYKKEHEKDGPLVFSVRVDPDGKVTSRPSNEDLAREALGEAKRLTAAKATVSIPALIDKIATHEKATVISVVLEDREDRKEKKGEGWLVYALQGDGIVWYEVDAQTGEVEKKKV